MKNTMKTLTKIRLVNWHYFQNETIEVKGSFLITGENTSGKSTILDAIQLVLTTNTRKFNIAANEKSKRDLKGYVRCKTGDEDNVYLRNGPIITYVALQFYEEKDAKFFTIGVKIDSPDKESRLKIRWFCEECKLEELTFISNNMPSTSEEFRINDRKVRLINQKNEARLRFARRLGNLEDRFFDMVPKSLAFKPMDKVKDFINKFILSERKIEIDSLRKNIESVKELEDLIDEIKTKIQKLYKIIQKYEEIEQKDNDIKINEVLISKAEIEECKLEINRLKKKIYTLNQNKKDLEEKKVSISSRHVDENDRLTELKLTLKDNETARLIKNIEYKLGLSHKDLEKQKEKFIKLEKMTDIVIKAFAEISKYEKVPFTKEQIINLKKERKSKSQNSDMIYDLERFLDDTGNKYRNKLYDINGKLKKLNEEKIDLEKDIKDLKNKKLKYPESCRLLKEYIEEEFKRHGIEERVRVLSELLEITDIKWQNAVEGYLDDFRFYLLVNPKYYILARDVYIKNREKIHTVGIIDTSKLNSNTKSELGFLSYIITSKNDYAKWYINNIFRNIKMCEDINDINKYKEGITQDCILYKDGAFKRIDEKIYNTPYIGHRAIEIQLENKEKDLGIVKENLKNIRSEKYNTEKIINVLKHCNIDTIKENINSPDELLDISNRINNLKSQLNNAKNNPNYIDINIDIERIEKVIKELSEKKEKIVGNIGRLEKEIETDKSKLDEKEKELKLREEDFEKILEEKSELKKLGLLKFNKEIEKKDTRTIIVNFSINNKGLETIKTSLIDELKDMQVKYNNDYGTDYEIGISAIDSYRKEHYDLEKSKFVEYENELEKVKYNCELEFKESFLANLKENIDRAYSEFKYLNKSLKGIYYGEDSYKFSISFNKEKETLYKMIMDERNFRDFTLLSDSFEEKYKEEINDLFNKLMAYDDKGNKIIEEYTDYRSYLDYDIIVEKKDGSRLRFSNIYGEKSGGETQTPYYVAIAASFLQLYKFNDTIRIIMLDEAFDKMDENRIESMMEFLASQNFQIIIAVPPNKMEYIGEKVDTILTTIRVGQSAIVERYEYVN